MSQIVRQWLKEKLDQLVNVQISTIQDEPDLLVHMWSGVRVRIHVVDKPLRLRQIKSTVHDASSLGVGTLFLVHHSLVPSHGQQAVLDEWLRVLHELTHEQMYIYSLSGMGPQVRPVHFEPVAGMVKWNIHYGPVTEIKHLRFYKRYIKARMIKGQWLVADFDTPAWWKDNDYRHQWHATQEARRRQEGRSTHWYTWSTGRTWQVEDDDEASHRDTNGTGASGQRQRGVVQTYLEECYKRLGVDQSATKEDIKAAFRKLALQMHPDTSELPPDEAELRFKALTEAYEYIKIANNWS